MRRWLSQKWKQAPGVRASLAALVIASILPVAAVATYLIVNFYDNEREQLINNTISRARTIITATDHDFESIELALEALGTSRMLQEGDLAGFHSRAAIMADKLGADSIILLDTSGRLLLSTARPYGTPLPRLEKTPLLKRILATGAPGVSDLFIGPVKGRYIYTIGVPIRRNGVIAMTLNVTITPRQLAQVLAEQKLPPSWRASVLDNTGHVVTRSHEIDKYAGAQVSNPVRQLLAGKNEQGMVSRTLDGVDVFVVFSRSPSTGWTALLGIPLPDLTAGLRTTLAWLIFFTVAALTAGLGLAWMLGGRIAHSVQALILPAQALGNARSAPIPPLSFKEANQLGQALHDAAASLERAHAATQESEQRLALAANAAHLGIWIRDLQRHDIWMSDQWRALFAFAPGQRVALADLLARVHPDDRAAVQHTLEQTQHGMPRYDMEYRIELPDGRLRWIGSHGSVECDEHGRPARVRGVSLDITQRKLAELDAGQKQKEVTHLARVAMLGELSGALAHELNQPLTAILSNAQAAQRFLDRPQPDLDEIREILGDIVSEDQRAGEVIQRLRRLFSKNEAQHQLVDLNQLVLDVLRLLRNDLINHGIAVSTELCSEPPVTSADAVQLQQVLINLIMNACDAMAAAGAQDGALTLRTALTADAVQCSIIDNGTGIAEATLARIFDPFFTTKERGMGLGLSICRNIVQAQRGTLRAENNPQRGASFHLALPRASNNDQTTTPAAPALNHHE